MNTEDGFRCAVCNRQLVAEGTATPFVRVYGYSRLLRVRGLPGEGPTVQTRHGEDWGDERLPYPVIDPVLRLREEEGEIEFVEHPLACATLECVTRLLLTLAEPDGLWEQDAATYGEPTAYVLMRACRLRASG